MKRSVSIRVSGVVQGVNFRTFTRTKAEELGLNGIVRNESDGSVYIEAEGATEQVEMLVIWCNTGPPRAKVKSTVVEECNVKSRKGFEIER